MTGKRTHPTSPVGSPSNSDDSPSKEQDKFLPIANVSRIMKKALPANANISKEAKETVQECVSEFISFITGEASDKCQREKRKTINGDDLPRAMTTLGFENYVGSSKVYLNKYRETEGDKNNPPSNHGVTNLTLDHEDHHGFFQEMKALPELHSMMTGDIRGGTYDINFAAFENMLEPVCRQLYFAYIFIFKISASAVTIQLSHQVSDIDFSLANLHFLHPQLDCDNLGMRLL